MGPMNLSLDEMARRYEADAQISGGVVVARQRQVQPEPPTSPPDETPQPAPRRRSRSTPPPAPVENLDNDPTI